MLSLFSDGLIFLIISAVSSSFALSFSYLPVFSAHVHDVKPGLFLWTVVCSSYSHRPSMEGKMSWSLSLLPKIEFTVVITG